MLTAEVIKGFTETVLASRYDNPKPVPDFHMELWDYCCRPDKLVAIAAPRGHAKSTAVTGAFTLASVLFRIDRHVMIISSNETMAAQFVQDLRIEISENEVLRNLFKIKKFIKEAETELIVQLQDNYRFRILAKGAGQRMRGLKWDNMRPSLIVGDDMEDEEMVENRDRRYKFRRWFYGAVKPILREGGRIRVVGTVMHDDALLENFMPDEAEKATVTTPLKVYSNAPRRDGWVGVKYRAHDKPRPHDSEHFLWESKFPKETMVAEYEDYADKGLVDVYSMEYLNQPIDDSLAFFKEDWFKASPDTEAWLKRSKVYYAAADFAITEKQHSDYTAMVVVSVDEDNRLEVVHARKGRWDAYDIIENLFEIQKRYRPVMFTVEAGAIEKSLGPAIRTEMRKRNVYLNLNPLAPTASKEKRAQAIAARMRVGDVYFTKEEPWYSGFEEEVRRFPRAKHDDFVDALSWIGLTMDSISEAPSRDEVREEWLAERRAERDHALEELGENGTNRWTGY